MRRYTRSLLLLSALLATVCPDLYADNTELLKPIVTSELIFEEREGIVAVEAEHFFEQTLTDKRAWYLTTRDATPKFDADGDPSHVGGASGGAYLELLPDTRRSHDDRLTNGENFTNEPGKMAVLSYKVHFNTPGTYWLWARAYTTTSEDNGLHFGIDGTWPETAQRWQTVVKGRWHWESKQRTVKVHTGVPGILTLNVDQPGVHTIHISMREDGIALDRILLANSRDYRPEGQGSASVVRTGTLPKPFAMVEAVPEAASATAPAPEATQDAQPDLAPTKAVRRNGTGEVTVSGELKQWHKVTFNLDGPFAHEQDNKPNPFTDYEMTVHAEHESGSPKYSIPGYFAADGNAGESSAAEGTRWRAHLSPDKAGQWNYRVEFRQGRTLVNNAEAASKPMTGFDGKSGTFTVAATDKNGPDLRAHGRLQVTDTGYLRFAGSGKYFLKAGPDAPETLLAYADFDGTEPGRKRNARSGEATPNQMLHHYQGHLQDFQNGDPTWKNGKGKALIGVINYLAAKGCNTLSFLPYNAGGDGDNVWPFTARTDKRHYDCSKLDQWAIVFDHAAAKGLHLHFKLQENEIDDNRVGHAMNDSPVAESLDGGKLGLERRLYCREIIARYGCLPALNWNLGEENTQSPEEQRDMISFLQKVDPYQHNVVIHTFPDQQDKVYSQLLAPNSTLTGASLQNGWNVCHQRTLKWIRESTAAGRRWIVANDEQNPASDGVPPDIGYQGHDGIAAAKSARPYTMHDIRKYTLWGTLMAGGAGVEYYFGYQLPQNDLVCEDFRSRDKSWDFCRIAVSFFHDNKIPFWTMACHDELIGNPQNDNSRYCFAKPGSVYLVYLPDGGSGSLDLSDTVGEFTVHWFNPRDGGDLQTGTVATVKGGGSTEIGLPMSEVKDDWLAVIRLRN